MGSRSIILVVDDEPANFRLLEGILRSPDYRIEFARGGMEGLAAVSALCPDLVLLDVMMPEVDGWQATRTIRAREQGGEASYIVALTANAFAEDRERCRAAGMDDFLTKPIDAQRLLAIAERFTRRASPDR